MGGHPMTRWDVIRKQILTRDDWKCVKCSGAANDVHHRKLKGIGGSKLLDIPENLVSLCRNCHTVIHLKPAQAYDTGFIVHSWEDPEKVPVKIYSGLFWLKMDGTRTFQGSCADPYYF